MFGAPIGGIDRRIEQEGPDRRKFAAQMAGEALHVGDPARPGKVRGQATDQVTACHGDPVRRHRSPTRAIPQRERVVQHRVHVAHPTRVRMIAGDQPTAAQQMRGMPMSAYGAVCRLPEYADVGAAALIMGGDGGDVIAIITPT
jgi:hypothetical protein